MNSDYQSHPPTHPSTPASPVPEPVGGSVPLRAAADTDLVARMRGGEREAAAEFIRRYGPRLRRRIRSRLGPRMRRVFDSQDILSTLSRRLDGFVERGRLNVQSENQLWAFIMRMATNAVIDKSRVLRRLRAAEGVAGLREAPRGALGGAGGAGKMGGSENADASLARVLAARIEVAEADSAGDGGQAVIDRAMAALDDPIDREILSLWLAGHPHTVTAQCVGLAPTAVRKRWQAIRVRLRGALERGGAL